MDAAGTLAQRNGGQDVVITGVDHGKISADFVGHVNPRLRGFYWFDLGRLLGSWSLGRVAARRQQSQTNCKEEIFDIAIAHIYFSLNVKLASAVPCGGTVNCCSWVPSFSCQT